MIDTHSRTQGRSRAGLAAIAAGAAFAAEGIVQVIHPQHTGSKVVGLSGQLNLAFFIVALLCAAPVIRALAGFARAGRAEHAARAAAWGAALLGVTSITSLALGHDGPWFTIIAPLTNAAWLFGSIALAVSLKRAGRVPTLIAIGLPIAWLGTIPLATLGGGLLTGAYFLYTGYLLNSELTSHTSSPTLRRATA